MTARANANDMMPTGALSLRPHVVSQPFSRWNTFPSSTTAMTKLAQRPASHRMSTASVFAEPAMPDRSIATTNRLVGGIWRHA